MSKTCGGGERAWPRRGDGGGDGVVGSGVETPVDEVLRMSLMMCAEDLCIRIRDSRMGERMRSGRVCVRECT